MNTLCIVQALAIPLIIFNLLQFMPFPSFATSGTDDVSFNITATILEPVNCTINNDEQIFVSFEDVNFDKIDGSTYQKQPININLKCKNLQNNELTLQVSGPTAAFNSDLLDVPEVEGIGIRLFYNGLQQPINRDFSINYTAPDALEAVLVKAPNAMMKTGSFSTMATLQVTYE